MKRHLKYILIILIKLLVELFLIDYERIFDEVNQIIVRLLKIQFVQHIVQFLVLQLFEMGSGYHVQIQIYHLELLENQQQVRID